MPERITNRLLREWERVIKRAKKVTLPGFDGMPIYDVSVFFWRSIVDGAITTRASAIAFNFFMALFPAILFLFNLIPIIKIEGFQEELFILIQDMLPEETFLAIQPTVIDIINRVREDLLSLSFFMALIFSTNGFASMMSAFDASLHSFKRRTWLGQRIIAIVLLGILSVMLILVIALLIGGQYLINYMVEHGLLEDSFTYYLLLTGKWFLIVSMFFFGNSFLYYLAPAKKNKMAIYFGRRHCVNHSQHFGNLGIYILHQ